MAVKKYADLNSLTRFKTKIEEEIPSNLSDLSDDNTHRVVTDAEKTSWNGKEDKTNKVTSISSSSTDTQYPSAKAVYDYIQSLDASEVSY